MSWAKVSDTAAFHPIVLRALEFDDADAQTVNEVFGFVLRCATQAAAYETDYVVDLGTAKLVAGITRYQSLAEQAVRAGYFSWVEVTGDDGQPRRALKLVEDENLFHMFLKSERDAENQRKRDGRNPELTVGARLRDGDQCRYCGNVVTFANDRRSGRAGQYDHVNGIQSDKPTVLEEYVVACRLCNQSKGEKSWTPLPAPEEPYYGKVTAAFLKKHGHDVPTARRVPTRPADPPQFTASQRRTVEQPPVAAPDGQATAPTGPASDLDAAGNGTTASQRRTVEQPPVAAPDGQGTAPTGPASDLDTEPARESEQQDPQDDGPEQARQVPDGHEYPESSRVGSGLGTGRDGPGSGGAGSARSSPPAGTQPRADPSITKRKTRRRPRNRKRRDQS